MNGIVQTSHPSEGIVQTSVVERVVLHIPLDKYKSIIDSVENRACTKVGNTSYYRVNPAPESNPLKTKSPDSPPQNKKRRLND